MIATVLRGFVGAVEPVASDLAAARPATDSLDGEVAASVVSVHRDDQSASSGRGDFSHRYPRLFGTKMPAPEVAMPQMLDHPASSAALEGASPVRQGAVRAMYDAASSLRGSDGRGGVTASATSSGEFGAEKLDLPSLERLLSPSAREVAVTAPAPWKPTRVRLIAGVVQTSTRPVRMRTDAGDAHVKVMGNPRGEHVLVADFVGTRVSALLGLPTFDVAILHLEECDEVDLGDGARAVPGPAFATRTMVGRPWGGTAKELDDLVNPDDVALLVVADTLLRNPDRCPRSPALPGVVERRVRHDNVFLASVHAGSESSQLVAMDFSDALTSGAEITKRVGIIDAIQDDGVYGLFPEFKPIITRERIRPAVDRLRRASRAEIGKIVADVPAEWKLSADARNAVTDMISTRASWLVDTIEPRLKRLCQPQGGLFDASDPRPEGE